MSASTGGSAAHYAGIDLFAPAHLKLVRFPAHSPLPIAVGRLPDRSSSTRSRHGCRYSSSQPTRLSLEDRDN